MNQTLQTLQSANPAKAFGNGRGVMGLGFTTKTFYYVAIRNCCKTEQLCRATEPLCRKPEQFLRKTEQLCRATEQLRRATESLRRATELLCRETEPLCRKTEQFCRETEYRLNEVNTLTCESEILKIRDLRILEANFSNPITNNFNSINN
jgi:hypothetical protein